MLVKAPGGGWETMAPGAEMPLGATFDTRHGAVSLTSAGCRGNTQTGRFGGGLFTLRQPRAACGRVDVYLRGGRFSAARAWARSGARAPAPSRPRPALAPGAQAVGPRQRRQLPHARPPQPGDGARHPLAHRGPLRRHAHARDERRGVGARLPSPPHGAGPRRPFVSRSGASAAAPQAAARSPAAAASWPGPREARGYPCPPWTATTPRRSSPSGRRSGPTSTPGRSRTTPGRAPKAYVLEMLPVPVGRAAHRAPEELLGGRRGRPLPPPHAATACCTRWATTPSACRPRTTRSRRASTRASRPRSRSRRSGGSSAGWGISIDWTREFGTHEPEYYRWTQWIFLRLFERGLAYRKEAAVKWCPNDQTVLANEQVIDGRCERCGHLVEVRQLEQWFFKITDYADRLLDDLETIDWPPHVVTMQRELDRPLGGRRGGLPLRGAGHRLPGLHHPARHALRRHLLRAWRRSTRTCCSLNDSPRGARLREPRAHRVGRGARRRAHARRRASRSGRTVTNPVNGEQIPICVADYVLMEYGTGAIMAVPAHDERDFEFADAVRPRDPAA